MNWRKTTDRPKVKEPIIILTNNRQVFKGYMNEFYFKGEQRPTYSFHGLYYDYNRHVLDYCLVNAIAWMPMPDEPTIVQFLKEHDEPV